MIEQDDLVEETKLTTEEQLAFALERITQLEARLGRVAAALQRGLPHMSFGDDLL